MKHNLLSMCISMLICFSFAPAQAQERERLAKRPEAPQPIAQTRAELSVLRLMKFSGVLRDRAGNPRTGAVGLTISLYRDQQGGSPLWLEVHNAQLDEQGRYTVLLGSTQSEGLPLELFASGEARWLGVQGQLPGEEEQPRVLLVSVPYALKAADAETLGGKPPSAFVLAQKAREEDAATQTEAGKEALKEGPERQLVTSGTAGRIAKFTNSTDLGDSVLFETAGGRIGLGTTFPESKFNVAVDGASDYITLSAYNVNLFDKGFLVRSARGPLGSPAPTVAGDILFNLYAQGFSGPDYGISGGITMVVDGPVSSGVVPGSIIFKTANTAGTFAERMRINPAGNVGIGTMTPTQTLEVVGNIKISGLTGNGIIFPDGSTLTSACGTLASLSPGTELNARNVARSDSPRPGQACSPAIFASNASGDIVVGRSAGTPVFRVDHAGKGFFNGGTQVGGADFAEEIEPVGDKDLYHPGDVLVIAGTKARAVERSTEPYSTRVAGIYSTKPGVLAAPRGINDPGLSQQIPLAVMGIVPCKVSAENGPINTGDLLVTSSKLGRAMKGTNRTRMLGAIVGKALEPLQTGTGVIQVLVTLQ